MDNPITISLVVSGVGMLILFLALAFLYGLIMLMTALIKDRPTNQPTSQQTNQQTNQQANQPTNHLRRAAVIAVALARAELDSVSLPEAEAVPSPWQQYHHDRLLNLPTRRGR